MTFFHFMAVLIVVLQVVTIVALIVTYRKKMAILNSHEKITASWRELLHDSRDLLNIAKLWAKVGEMKSVKADEAVEKITVVADEIKQVIKDKN